MDYKQGKEDQIFFFNWDSYVEKTCQVNQLFKPEIVSDYTKEFSEVFNEKEFDHLPERRSQNYAIELTPRFTPVDCKIYLLNYEEQQVLDEFLAENLRNGCICLSKSPIASLFFFVKKKDGKLCLVQDYCKLNQETIKNKYSLLLI